MARAARARRLPRQTPGPRAALALVLASAGVLGGLGALVGPAGTATGSASATALPLARATLVCPSPGGPAGTTGTVTALTLPWTPAPVQADELGEPAGAGTLVPLTGPRPRADLGARGTPVRLTADDPTQAFVVSASGDLAPGLVAEQSTVATGDETRGVADTACTSPAAEHWFVGASALTGRRARLILTNPAGAAVVATVTVWDESGPVNTPAAQDVGIPGRSQKEFLLDALTGGSDRVALHVSASQGRVAAAVVMAEVSGLQPRGLTWVPAAAPPARAVVVPGLPPTGQRLLQVLVPGRADAIVTVRLSSPEGSFVPAQNGVLTVRAGSVGQVDVGPALGASSAAVLVSSDVPVTAAVRLVSPAEGAPGGAARPDLAVAASAAPLHGPAAALVVRASGDAAQPSVSSALLLTATGSQPARVRVRLYRSDGMPLRSADAVVPPGATRRLELLGPYAPAATPGQAPEPLAEVVAVVDPQPGGPVVAARVTAGADASGAVLDVLALGAAPFTVTVAPVRPDVSTGLSRAG